MLALAYRPESYSHGSLGNFDKLPSLIHENLSVMVSSDLHSPSSPSCCLKSKILARASATPVRAKFLLLLLLLLPQTEQHECTHLPKNWSLRALTAIFTLGLDLGTFKQVFTHNLAMVSSDPAESPPLRCRSLHSCSHRKISSRASATPVRAGIPPPPPENGYADLKIKMK